MAAQSASAAVVPAPGVETSAREAYCRAMLLRLLLALFVVCLPLSASAAPVCTGAMPGATMAHGGGDHHRPAREERVAPPHACIGCVPPGSLLAPRADAPVLFPATLDVGSIARLIVGATPPPATPPPRDA